MCDYYSVLCDHCSVGVNDSDCGIDYGTVDYWVRLRVPMEQALRLYKVRLFIMQHVYKITNKVVSCNNCSVCCEELQSMMNVTTKRCWNAFES